MRVFVLGLVAACTTATTPEPEPTPAPTAAPATPWLAAARGSYYTRTSLSITAHPPDTTLLAYSQSAIASH